MFQVKHYGLPHDAAMPGAAGHKKVLVSRGTKVFCIVYGTKVYWCAYLHERDALKALAGLQATVSGNARRTITLDALIAWNFKDAMPRRVYRSDEYRKREQP